MILIDKIWDKFRCRCRNKDKGKEIKDVNNVIGYYNHVWKYVGNLILLSKINIEILIKMIVRIIIRLRIEKYIK